MTPKEFASEMLKISTDPNGDTEGDHLRSDELMMKVLRSLGYGEGVDIFDATDRWYA